MNSQMDELMLIVIYLVLRK